ncbi:Protein of unknown function [Leuconostoc citreum LBAE C10]|nr:Protein of unknown function [Leuconostoc citreum LBAE C10]
MINMPY